MLNKFLNEYESKNRTSRSLELVKLNLEDTEKIINKPLETMEKEDIVGLVQHLKKERKFEQGTLNIRISKIIQFFNWCFDETDNIKYRKLIKKLKEYVKRVDSDIKPEDIFAPEEIKRVINVATLERDRCLVAVLYEGGLRLGELTALTNSMVEMNEQSQEVTFHIPDQEGCKTGARSVLCLEVFGYVQDWMKCNTSNQFMLLSENGIRKVTKNLFKRAGIDKPSNPHMFRHSSITNACIMKMQPNQISMRYWGIPNSNMLSVYLHLSEQIVSSGYRDAKGMGNGNGSTVINPLASRCVVCGRLVQAGELCVTCKENKQLKERLDKRDAEFEDMKRKMETFAAILAAKQQA